MGAWIEYKSSKVKNLTHNQMQIISARNLTHNQIQIISAKNLTHDQWHK